MTSPTKFPQASTCHFPMDALLTMSRGHNQIARAKRIIECPMLAKSPLGAVETSHGNDFSIAQCDENHRITAVWVPFVLPREVGGVQLEIGSPEMCLQSNDLVAKLRTIRHTLVTHRLEE
jgi:hypothetical protein